MTYKEYKEKAQKEVDSFLENYGFVSFDFKQFEKGVKKLKVKNPKKEIAHIGAGVFTTKKHIKKFEEEQENRISLLEENLKKDIFLEEALFYELGNTEYSYTMDPTDAIENLYGKVDKINDQDVKRIKKVIQKYEKKYMED